MFGLGSLMSRYFNDSFSTFFRVLLRLLAFILVFFVQCHVRVFCMFLCIFRCLSIIGKETEDQSAKKTLKPSRSTKRPS